MSRHEAFAGPRKACACEGSRHALPTAPAFGISIASWVTVMAALGQDGAGEAAAVCDQVDRFARRALEGLVRHPERPAHPDQMERLLDEARELGVLTEGTDEGAGVWDDSLGVAVSTQVLRRLAASNAGFALAVHRASLGRWIVGRIGVRPRGRGGACVQGRFGLGRLSLARALAGAALEEDDRIVLLDCYGVHAERLLTTDVGLAWVVTPVFDLAQGGLAWRVWSRESLSILVRANAHGFDELATFAFRPKGDAQPLASVADKGVLAAALGRETLGLMAIGLGAAEHGHAMARAYAAARTQGGRPIEHHAAVQLLLASSRSAITTVEALLQAAAQRSVGRTSLGFVIAARTEAHPLLCRASNDDLQVFGGSGYMRDTGAEKIVRDQNHLRAMSGSPLELALFSSEWERLGA